MTVIEMELRSRRFDRDARWSETGDRYILKLFRDYVFHTVDEQGNPVVNLGHVLTHLNKVTYAFTSFYWKWRFDEAILNGTQFWCCAPLDGD